LGATPVSVRKAREIGTAAAAPTSAGEAGAAGAGGNRRRAGSAASILDPRPLRIVADVDDGAPRGGRRHQPRHGLHGVGDVAERAALLAPYTRTGLAPPGAQRELGHHVVGALCAARTRCASARSPRAARDARGVDHAALTEELLAA